mmetsp:Transcript_67232/g.161113  ORF Transcript_67232/g.161113 Transcript_67232/m.161113 type:complete len:1051 (-) Transcript_67232:128-3280(-)
MGEPKELGTGQLSRVHFTLGAKSKTLKPPRHGDLLKALTLNIVATYAKCSSDFKYSEEKAPRRWLTKPWKGVYNQKYDNIENDYICSVGDKIVNPDGHAYEVVEALGQGTFGQVLKCVAPGSPAVALKIIKNKPEYFQQALNEVRILKLLNEEHDPTDEAHIVRMRDYFVYRQHLCIAFELLIGNLFDVLRQNNFKPFPMLLIRELTRQLLKAMNCLANANIIHCDLKPENVLLSSTKHPIKVKLCDLGSACLRHAQVSSYIQSRFYRSPEVLLGMRYTSAIDMWSLGCICGELFLGLPIFPGVSQYDQIRRIIEVLGPFPISMLRVGKHTKKYFCLASTPIPVQEVPAPAATPAPTSAGGGIPAEPSPGSEGAAPASTTPGVSGGATKESKEAALEGAGPITAEDAAMMEPPGPLQAAPTERADRQAPRMKEPGDVRPRSCGDGALGRKGGLSTDLTSDHGHVPEAEVKRAKSAGAATSTWSTGIPRDSLTDADLSASASATFASSEAGSAYSPDRPRDRQGGGSSGGGANAQSGSSADGGRGAGGLDKADDDWDSPWRLRTRVEYERDTGKKDRSPRANSVEFHSLRELIDKVKVYRHLSDSAKVQELARREDFLHFLVGILALVPEERMTPGQAIHHPFITGASASKDSSSASSPSQPQAQGAQPSSQVHQQRQPLQELPQQPGPQQQASNPQGARQQDYYGMMPWYYHQGPTVRGPPHGVECYRPDIVVQPPMPIFAGCWVPPLMPPHALHRWDIPRTEWSARSAPGGGAGSGGGTWSDSAGASCADSAGSTPSKIPRRNRAGYSGPGRQAPVGFRGGGFKNRGQRASKAMARNSASMSTTPGVTPQGPSMSSVGTPGSQQLDGTVLSSRGAGSSAGQDFPAKASSPWHLSSQLSDCASGASGSESFNWNGATSEDLSHSDTSGIHFTPSAHPSDSDSMTPKANLPQGSKADEGASGKDTGPRLLSVIQMQLVHRKLDSTHSPSSSAAGSFREAVGMNETGPVMPVALGQVNMEQLGGASSSFSAPNPTNVDQKRMRGRRHRGQKT